MKIPDETRWLIHVSDIDWIMLPLMRPITDRATQVTTSDTEFLWSDVHHI